MNYLTDNILMASIGRMPRRFDSHKLIYDLMRNYPQQYTQELCGLRRTHDPIRILHSNIAKKIAQQRFNLRRIRKISTRNIRNLHTPNQKWEKL